MDTRTQSSGFMLVVTFLVSVYILSAPIATAQPLQLIDIKQGEKTADRLGWTVEGLGDINNDSFTDFLFSQHYNPQRTFLYLGGPHPFADSTAMEIGSYIYPTSVGDIDCDGVQDFFVFFANGDTARLYTDIESLNPNGYLIFYPDANPLKSWNYYVGGGGDNDADGRPEFWVYRYENPAESLIVGYHGCDLLDTNPDDTIILSINPDYQYGGFSRKLCTTCDLNGDSIPDIIFGQYTAFNEYPGRVCITWGGPSLSFRPDVVFYAPGMGAIDDYGFGSDIACLGDISGDGIDDLWVRQGGRNYVYHGGRPFDTLVDLALDYSYTSKVEMVGDVNHDGWNDIMLVYDRDIGSQIAIMYCGPDMDTIVDVRYTEGDFNDVTSAAGFPGDVQEVGRGCSWVGDVNGDGRNDILLGASTSSNSSWDHGWVFVVSGWGDTGSAVDPQIPHNLPTELELKQNYPNPFNPATTIEFTLPRSGYAEVRVYNLLGEVVAIPMQGYLTAGSHQVEWDGLSLDGKPAASGIYFYRLTSGSHTQTRKMVLLK